MQYIILDLESTCSEDHSVDNEIIEIGAVKLNSKLEVVDKFTKFIKPVRNPELTDFCVKLTTITQKDVDQADLFAEVLKEFLAWVNDKGDTIYGSWGFYDRKQFIKDCEYHNLSDSWIKGKHISIKHQHYAYALEGKARKAVGMERALNLANIKLEGTHHRGIDDAINISKIFIKYFDKWNFNEAK